MQVYSYQPNRPPVKKRKSKRYRAVAAAFFVLIVAVGLMMLQRNQSPSGNQATPASTLTNVADKKSESKTVAPLPNVQSLVEAWAGGNSGSYSIVVDDLDAKTQLASYRADEPYFAASIYKLYVAYLGLIDAQAGKYSMDEPYLNGWTRARCLDEMIRNSYSPCAEKLWAEQGRETSTERLKKYGLTGTNMVGLITTARDVNVLLGRLYNRQELNEKYTQMLLDPMKGQKYRDAIPAGVPGLIVYDKVGFRELVEYHDTAIVTLPNGRNVAITILTKNAGTRRIADLTKQIFAALQK